MLVNNFTQFFWTGSFISFFYKVEVNDFITDYCLILALITFVILYSLIFLIFTYPVTKLKELDRKSMWRLELCKMEENVKVLSKKSWARQRSWLHLYDWTPDTFSIHVRIEPWISEIKLRMRITSDWSLRMIWASRMSVALLLPMGNDQTSIINISTARALSLKIMWILPRWITRKALETTIIHVMIMLLIKRGPKY